MWIVRPGLRRTYPFVVAALPIDALGAACIHRVSTDVFPIIDILVGGVLWQFTGTPADETETSVLFVNEQVLTASVNDVGHIEGQSLDSAGVIRIYFRQQQNALQIALQQTTALLQASSRQNSVLSQTALRQRSALQTALQRTTALHGGRVVGARRPADGFPAASAVPGTDQPDGAIDIPAPTVTEEDVPQVVLAATEVSVAQKEAHRCFAKRSHWAACCSWPGRQPS